MTQLERLRLRRESWLRASGPRWLMFARPTALAALDKEITRLEAEQAAGK